MPVTQPTQPFTSPETLPLPLQVGDRGEAIVQLQTALNDRGYYLTVDGDFGLATKAAVLEFQQEHQLVGDGIVGSATWVVLLNRSPDPINFVQVCQSYHSAQYPQQTAAICFLDEAVAYNIRREFVRRWYNQPAPSADPILSEGDRGIAVVALQHLLNARIGANLEGDGIFGSATTAAVVRFQRSLGLTADGIVGAQTWQELRAANLPALTTLFRTYDPVDYPHQTAALGWFQRSISGPTIGEFARLWRQGEVPPLGC